MKTIHICVSVVAIALACSAVTAETRSFEPSGVLPMKLGIGDPASAFALNFDLSELHQDSTMILLAELRLWLDTDSSESRPTVEVFAASESWSPSELATTGRIARHDSILADNQVNSGDGGYVEINVTNIVQRWFFGQFDRRGFVVRLRNDRNAKLELNESGGRFRAKLYLQFTKM